MVENTLLYGSCAFLKFVLDFFLLSGPVLDIEKLFSLPLEAICWLPRVLLFPPLRVPEMQQFVAFAPDTDPGLGVCRLLSYRLNTIFLSN